MELMYIEKKRQLLAVFNIIVKSIKPLLARVHPGCLSALCSNVSLKILNIMTRSQWGNLPLRSCPILKK